MDEHKDYWDGIGYSLHRHGEAMSDRLHTHDSVVREVDYSDSAQQPRTVIPVPAPHVRELCRSLNSLDGVAQAVLGACSRDDRARQSGSEDTERLCEPIIDDELMLAMTEFTARAQTSPREKNLLTSIIALAEKLHATHRRLAAQEEAHTSQPRSSHASHMSASSYPHAVVDTDRSPSAHHEDAKARYEHGLVMSRILTILGGAAGAETAATLPQPDLTFHALRELEKCNEVVGDVLTVTHLHTLGSGGKGKMRMAACSSRCVVYARISSSAQESRTPPTAPTRLPPLPTVTRRHHSRTAPSSSNACGDVWHK